MENIEFGKRLEILMKTRKISNQELTEKAELSKNNVGNYKKGQIPNAEMLYRISQILGTSMEWLLTGKEQTDLTEEESILINNYRAASPEGRGSIQALAAYQASASGVSTSKAGRTGTDN